MKISMHAELRMQQRGIPPQETEYIMDRGRSFQAPKKATHPLITKKERTQWIEFHRQQIKQLEKTANKAVLVSDDGCVITVQHRYKKFRKDRGA
jgi:hypothetical protein